jgi:hypothetical protein
MMVTITLQKTERLYSIGVDLIDTKTAEPIAKQAVKDVKEEDIASKIKASTVSLLANVSPERAEHQ